MVIGFIKSGKPDTSKKLIGVQVQQYLIGSSIDICINIIMFGYSLDTHFISISLT